MQPDRIADLLPDATADTAPFYEALDDGRFDLQECSSCGRLRYPIAPLCPYCFDEGLRWRSCDGGGVIHSWVRYHRAFVAAFEPLVPYVVVTVQLDEGPRVYGRLLGITIEAVAIGDRVEAIVERSHDGRGVLAFAPVGTTG
jgi:uncharacterized OB-fold protein